MQPVYLFLTEIKALCTRDLVAFKRSDAELSLKNTQVANDNTLTFYRLVAISIPVVVPKISNRLPMATQGLQATSSGLCLVIEALFKTTS